MTDRRRLSLALGAGLVAAMLPAVRAEAAPSAAEVNRDAAAALERLHRTKPITRELAQKAAAILVFPEVVKAGLMIGGEIGYGALRRQGRTVAHYRTYSVSYGLQVGAQKYAYALFLMNEAAVEWLERSDGWEIGTGPSFVLVDDGFAARMSSTTLTQDVYGFVFGQSGLMAGIGLSGTKIQRWRP